MGWRLNRESSKVYFYDGPNGQIKVTLGSQTEQGIRVNINDEKSIYYDYFPEDESLSNQEALRSFRSWASRKFDDHVSITRLSEFYQIPFPSHDAANSASADAITAPMPGKIIALNVAVGDSVSKGDALVVMEAMKMEQTLTAPRDGIIAEIGAGVGELVTDGAILVQLEEEE